MTEGAPGDDPAYFGDYIDDKLEAARRELGLSDAQLATLARNSFDACFAPEDAKARWKAEVEDYAAGKAPAVGQAAGRSAKHRRRIWVDL